MQVTVEANTFLTQMKMGSRQGGQRSGGRHVRTISYGIFLSCVLFVVARLIHQDLSLGGLGVVNDGHNNVPVIEQASVGQKQKSASDSGSGALGTDKEAFSKLQLFVPAFPGGFQEMQSSLIRSLEFFWPHDVLDILVVLDESVYHNNETEKAAMTAQVKSMFRGKDLKSVEVTYNPRCDKRLLLKGWNIQQLIMLWADNFTTSEFIGFLDDDTLFTKAIIPYDIFDSQGRPRAIVKYPNGIEKMDNLIKEWYKQSDYMFGQPAYVNGMTNFPVVIRREHLPEIRQAMLDQHPEFATFDDLFISLVHHSKSYSQFVFMCDFLWRTHRDKYSWHLEADQYDVLTGFVNNTPEMAKRFAIKDGSPEENGVTPEMLKPFPRCVVHFGAYDHIRDISQRKRAYPAHVTEYMRRGFCFSLPQQNDATSNPDKASCCQVYNVSTEINQSNEWVFEQDLWGKLWPVYDYPGALRAHGERMDRNVPHKWDSDELSTIFGGDSCGKVNGLF